METQECLDMVLCQDASVVVKFLQNLTFHEFVIFFHDKLQKKQK